MAKNTAILDTNILARLFLRDVPDQHTKVVEFITNQKDNSLHILDSVILELFHIMNALYGLTKKDIVLILKSIVVYEKFIVNETQMHFSIQIYEQYQLSFQDAYLIAHALINKAELITFDKKMKKVYKKLLAQQNA